MDGWKIKNWEKRRRESDARLEEIDRRMLSKIIERVKEPAGEDAEARKRAVVIKVVAALLAPAVAAIVKAVVDNNP